MRRDPQSAAAAPSVVHVVGCLGDEVIRFLGPATAALARSGHEQAVVLIDEARRREHLLRLHDSVELVLVQRQRNPIAQWRAVARACRHLLAGAPVQAVHLHGLRPALVGANAVRESGQRPSVFFSPHGTRGWRALGARLVSAVRLPLSRDRGAVILGLPAEADAFRGWSAIELVESPLHDAYFNVPRREARHPLVVTGDPAQDARSAEMVAQLAVLLGGEPLRISFNWCGAVDPVSRQRLNAAGVGVFESRSDEESAARLGAGWIYVAAGRSRRFALPLVQAMAAGLPCVALDCDRHREVVRDGETGFLCSNEHTMMARIAALVDDEALRRRLGAAARQEARQRFGAAAFSARLLAAYALPTGAPA